MDYNQLFNSNYINEEQYRQMLIQKSYIEQMVQYEQNQQIELEKMAKALNDFLDSIEKISLQHQDDVIKICLFEIGKRRFDNR